MAQGVFKLLAKVQLGATIGTVYDPGLAAHIGVGQMARVKQIVISNTDTAARPTTVYYTPSGTTAGVPEQIVPGANMNANEAVFIELDLPLSFGDKLEGLATAAGKVNVFIFGDAPAGE